MDNNSLPQFDRARIYENILEAIGGTPMVKLGNIAKEEGIECELVAKCEYFNSGGSVKDRIGKMMLQKGLEDGIIKKGSTIIEPTSGNTGIGLSLCSALLGLKSIIVIPEKMSKEKIDVLKALGSKIVKTPTAASHDSPESHICVADRINKSTPDSWIPNQYENEYNWKAHYEGTAEEILVQCNGKIDALVCGAGTGGTITGVSRKLKEKVPGVKIVGVDPKLGSILSDPSKPLTEEENKPYLVEGIGYDFVPSVLDYSHIDEWIKVSDKDAFQTARRLISSEGILCGGSSGASVYAAIQYAKKMKKGERLVVILPDSLRNYMTKHLDPDWMVYNDLADPELPHLKSAKLLSSTPDSTLTVSVLADSLCTLIDSTDQIASAYKLFAMKNLSHAAVVKMSAPYEPLFVISKNTLIEASADGIPLTSSVSLLSKYVAGNPCMKSPQVLKHDSPLSKAIAKLVSDGFIIVAPKVVSKVFPSLRIITDTDLVSFIAKYAVDISPQPAS